MFCGKLIIFSSLFFITFNSGAHLTLNNLNWRSHKDWSCSISKTIYIPFAFHALCYEMFNASLPAPVSCFECEDDLYQDCQRRSLRGLCEGRGLTGEEKMKTVLYMLSFCRRSCRVIFRQKHFLTGLKKK